MAPRTTSFCCTRWLRRCADNEAWRALDELGFPTARRCRILVIGTVDPRSPIDVGGKTYAAGSYLAVQYDDVVQNDSKAPRVALFEPTPTTSLASVSTTKDR